MIIRGTAASMFLRRVQHVDWAVVCQCHTSRHQLLGDRSRPKKVVFSFLLFCMGAHVHVLCRCIAWPCEANSCKWHVSALPDSCCAWVSDYTDLRQVRCLNQVSNEDTQRIALNLHLNIVVVQTTTTTTRIWPWQHPISPEWAFIGYVVCLEECLLHTLGVNICVPVASP